MIIKTNVSEEDRLAFEEAYMKHDFSIAAKVLADKIDEEFLKQYMAQKLQEDMKPFYEMATKDWPVVKEAKAAAKHQLKFYELMMYGSAKVPNRQPRGID